MRRRGDANSGEKQAKGLCLEWRLRSHSSSLAITDIGNRLRKNLMESQKNSIFAQ